MEFINKNPKIYILSGKARSGKDTCASYIKEYYESMDKKVVNLQYSMYLKEYAKKITDWDGSDDNKPRQLLIDLGTDLIRGNIDRYLFVNRMLQDITVLAYFFDIITISDARLVEELEIPKEKINNVFVIKMERPNYENGLSNEQKKTLTESALDNYDNYDYKIINDGSLLELKDKINEMLEGLV